MKTLLSALALLLLPGIALATTVTGETLDLTHHPVGYWAIGIFVVAYLLVMAEEFTHLRKSKPVILAAGIIWALIAAVYVSNGMTHTVEAAAPHNLLEYAELPTCPLPPEYAKLCCFAQKHGRIPSFFTFLPEQHARDEQGFR